jgi:L-amino acid N-acyltransferase YncA
MRGMDIRRAHSADLPAVAAIDEREAREGHATFDVEGRSAAQWGGEAGALPNPASLALHRACGFEEVAVIREVGRKHGRWIDITWLQRLLGPVARADPGEGSQVSSSSSRRRRTTSRPATPIATR